MSKTKYFSKMNVVYLTFISLMLLMHMKMKIYGDDTWFKNLITHNNFDIFNYSMTYYLQWSSRFLINTTALFFHTINFNFFKIANIVVIVAIIVIMKYLANIKGSNYLSTTALFFIYPFLHMMSAGWASTCISYLWPLLAYMIIFIPIIENINNIKTSLIKFIVSVMAYIFAVNSEPLVVMSFVLVPFCYLCLTNKNREIKIYFSILILLTIAGLLNIIYCPGNPLRFSSEILRWMPDFRMMSFADKLYLGVITTLSHFILEPNALFFVFSCITCLLVFNIQDSIVKRLVALIPVLIFLTINCFYPSLLVDKIQFFHSSNIDSIIGSTYAITIENVKNVSTYAPIIISVLILICLSYSIYNIFGDRPETFTIHVVLIAGLASRIVLGFSPTLFASGPRTYIYLYFAIIYISISLLNKLLEVNYICYKYTIVTLCVFAFINYIAIFNSI